MTSEHPTPRLGAAYVRRHTPAGVRVFGVVSNDGTAAGLVPLTSRLGSWSTGHCGGEHLWMVCTTVREQLRWSAAPVGPFGARGRHGFPRSAMRLQLTTCDAAGGSVYELDLGQSIEIYAASLTATLITPAGSAEVTEDHAEPQQGLLFDSHCLVRMLQLETARGISSALLTETVHVPADQSHTLRVPTAARRLTAYAAPMESPPVWRWLRGEPSSLTVPLGQIAWSIDRPRGEVDVPSATHLQIEPDSRSRVFTLVWTITP